VFGYIDQNPLFGDFMDSRCEFTAGTVKQYQLAPCLHAQYFTQMMGGSFFKLNRFTAE
jgi:hypothetical protein